MTDPKNKNDENSILNDIIKEYDDLRGIVIIDEKTKEVIYDDTAFNNIGKKTYEQ